jgi:hypothetical protein
VLVSQPERELRWLGRSSSPVSSTASTASGSSHLPKGAAASLRPSASAASWCAY